MMLKLTNLTRGKALAVLALALFMTTLTNDVTYAGDISTFIDNTANNRKHNLKQSRYHTIDNMDIIALYEPVEQSSVQSIKQRKQLDDNFDDVVYEMVASLLPETGPIAKLRNWLTPLTRLTTVYRSNDGDYSTSMFGQGVSGSETATGSKIFSLSFAFTGSNLDIKADIYENFTLSYSDGRKLNMLYAFSGGSNIGITAEGNEKVELSYSIRF